VIEADNLLIHLLSNAFLPVCLQGSRCQTRLCSSEQRPAAFFAARNVSRGPLPPPPPLFLLPLMHLFTHYPFSNMFALSDLLNDQNAEGSAACWNRCIFPIAGAVCAAPFGCSAVAATMARA